MSLGLRAAARLPLPHLPTARAWRPWPLPSAGHIPAPADCAESRFVLRVSPEKKMIISTRRPMLKRDGWRKKNEGVDGVALASLEKESAAAAATVSLFSRNVYAKVLKSDPWGERRFGRERQTPI